MTRKIYDEKLRRERCMTKKLRLVIKLQRNEQQGLLTINMLTTNTRNNSCEELRSFFQSLNCFFPRCQLSLLVRDPLDLEHYKEKLGQS